MKILRLVVIALICNLPYRAFAQDSTLLPVPAMPNVSAASPVPAPTPTSTPPSTGTVDGYFGLKWHDSKDTVKTTMAAKYTLVDDSIDDGKLLLFAAPTGQMIAGEPVHECNIIVGSDGFLKAIVTFEANDTGDEAIDQYEHIKDLLKEKYGAPNRDYRIFLDPFTDGDGYASSAIESDKAHFLASWICKSSSGDKVDVYILINTSLEVTISYENAPMMKAFQAQEDANNSQQL